VALREGDYVSAQELEAKRGSAGAAAAVVRADSAEVIKAALDVDNCTIRAPIDGRTGSLFVHQGNLVKANNTDTPLVTINQVRPILVRFTVPQTDLPRIVARRGQRLAAYAWSSDADSSSSEGVLSFVDNMVDATTGTILLKAEFQNRDGRLWPGGFVRLRLVLSTDPHATVIPAPAVTNGQSGSFVYVVNADTTVSTRPIDIERAAGDLVVIRSGIQPGEQVVVDGQLRLSPGAKITIKTVAVSPAASQPDTLKTALRP
jgi:multidrug efflux system membrane fusion protein